MGYQVYRNFEDIRERDIDIVTLFHVFEHFQEPLNALKTIKTLMKPGGKIVIEVPHARDILLSTFDNEAFKAFTFWSEHLILHTRQSLMVFLQAAGFQNISVEGFQRYPLANHLYWLAKGRPGGHSEWRHLKSTGLDSEYEKLLIRLDQTDTLIASARA